MTGAKELVVLALAISCALGRGLKRNEPHCPEANGNIANPDDCTTFYICDHGTPWLTYCPPGLYYDSASNACVYPEDSDCLQGSTKPPTTSTEKETTVTTTELTTTESTTKESTTTESTTTESTTTESTTTESTTTEATTTELTSTTNESTTTESTTTQSTTTESTTTEATTTELTTIEPTTTEKSSTAEPGTTPPSEGETCSSPGTLSPNPEDCSSYFICDNGLLVLLPCPPGLEFNPYVHVCELPEQAHCGARVHRVAECTTEGQLLPNPANCSTFFLCNAGNPVLMECPAGLYFNEEALYCDAPENTNCHAQSSSSDSPTSTTSTPTDFTSSTVETTWTNTDNTPTPTDFTSSTVETTWTNTDNTPTPTDFTSSTVETTWTNTDNTPTPTDFTSTTVETTWTNTPPTSWTDGTTVDLSTPGFNPNCPPSGTHVLPNPFDCGTFYVCIEGESALVECPLDFGFDPQEGECTPTGCEGWTTPTQGPTTSWTDATSSTTDSTTDSWVTETTTVSYDTTTSSAETTTVSYDTTTSSAETTTVSYDTTTSSAETTTVSYDTTTSSATTNGPTDSTTGNPGNVPDCPENSPGEVLFPNINDCGSYYVCDNGVPVLLPCPPGLEFDSLLHVCLTPDLAHCDANS